MQPTPVFLPGESLGQRSLAGYSPWGRKESDMTLVQFSCPVVSDSLQAHGLCNPQGSSVHGILQARILEWVACPPPGDLPNPGIEPMSLMAPALAGRFFTTSASWETGFIFSVPCNNRFFKI